MGNLRKLEENFPYFLEHVREVLNGLPFFFVRNNRILHRRLNLGMSQEPHHGVEVATRFQKQGGVRVPRRVPGDVLPDSGFGRPLVDVPVGGCLCSCKLRE